MPEAGAGTLIAVLAVVAFFGLIFSVNRGQVADYDKDYEMKREGKPSFIRNQRKFVNGTQAI